MITLKYPTHSYEYYKMLIGLKLKELQRNSKGTNTKYLTMGIFERMQVQVPLEKFQEKFSSIAKTFEGQNKYLNESQAISNNLFNSLVQRAFRGEL